MGRQGYGERASQGKRDIDIPVSGGLQFLDLTIDRQICKRLHSPQPHMMCVTVASPRSYPRRGTDVVRLPEQGRQRSNR
jgi:hypothetical protein